MVEKASELRQEREWRRGEAKEKVTLIKRYHEERRRKEREEREEEEKLLVKRARWIAKGTLPAAPRLRALTLHRGHGLLGGD